MAMDAYLKLDGIDGEATAKGKEKWIQVIAFSLGASNPSSVATGMGSGSGRVDISALSVQKTTDSASAALFLKCCNGTHIATGQLVVREAGGEQLEYLIMKFEQIFVDSIQWGGAEGGGKPSESIALSFGKIEIEYYPQKADGSLDAPLPASWSQLELAGA